MRSHWLLPFVFLGCSSATASFLDEHQHPPLRTACQASDLPLFVAAKLSCSAEPPSPTSLDPEYWSSGRPTKSRRELADGTPLGTVSYDYAQPQSQANAVYRDDGNIASVTFPDQFPGQTSPTFGFGYEGDTLISAYVDQPDGARIADVSISYEDGRRSVEKEKTHDKEGYRYAYDTDGRVVSRRGLGTMEALPATADADFVAHACERTAPLIAEGDDPLSIVGGIWWIRGASGRVEAIIDGRTPGFAYIRRKLEYDAQGRLTQVTIECSQSTEQAPGRTIYEY